MNTLRSQRPNQEGVGLRQCAVIAGTKFVVPWRWQTPRWLDRVVVASSANGRCLVWDFTCPDTLISRQSPEQCIAGFWNCGKRHGITEVDQILVAFRPLPLHSNCNWEFWDTGCIPGDESLAFFHDLGQRIAVATCHSWTTFIPVSDAAS